MTDTTNTDLAQALREMIQAVDTIAEHFCISPQSEMRDHADSAYAHAKAALAAHDAARAQPASAPGGWVVVPSAPTSAMVEACVKLKLDRLKGFMEGDYEPKDVRQSTVEDWLAMLAAAPQPAKESDQ